MDARVGLLFLFVLGAGWACAARQMAATEISGLKITTQDQHKEVQASDEVTKDNQVCTLCEEFATQAIDYLAENKTQTEVIDRLHEACSRVRSFEQQCITLVDYYTPLLFLEISSIQPEDFCKRVNLCQEMTIIFAKAKEDSCGICHRAISEVLSKLKDPDTQLEILELLLKGCNSMKSNAQKCKRMVFEYAPLILANAEQFLETTDICVVLHACDSNAANGEQAATVLKADS